MVNNPLQALIEQKFALKPTDEQSKAVEMFVDFCVSRHPDTLFLLTGYAGTGKTTLVGAIVKAMLEMKQRVVLLAPTGRAAKVFSLHADMPASTIHRRIYRETMGVEIRQEAMDAADDTSLDASTTSTFARNASTYSLNPGKLNHQTLFIVDEASMIANEGLSGGMFGTGRLLDDLIQFVYGGENCRLMLIGDSAQLPPVGEELSPALSPEALAGYGLQVMHSHLTEVVRQAHESGILWNATMLRNLIYTDDMFQFPRLNVSPFADIEVVMGNELIECLEDSYYHVGQDETIVVTRSNKRANIFNLGIRGRILGYEEELSSCEQVIVVKNNYFWLKDHSAGQSTPSGTKAQVASTVSPATAPSPSSAPSFLANGDLAVVRRFRNERSQYGFRFADAILELPDYDNMEVECTLLLDVLQAEAPALTVQQQDQLFNAVWEDYPDITNRRTRMQRIRDDIYYNALQVKYAYAVTCHKAQGGQWAHVYIDQGYITEDMLTPDYFRWLYTAITRATEKVYLINWPKAQLTEE